MKQNKIVAIWAPLRYANVGDDMQAIAMALHIRNLGYDVKLYQLEQSLADKYNMKSCGSINELLDGVNLCIIAGGALLTPFRWYKRILNKAAREYEHDFKELYLATLTYPNINFCAISFGGDGKVKNPETWFSKWRIKFFESPSFIDGTVRLQGDVEMMKIFGKNEKYYPDMLFQAPHFFDCKPLAQTKKRRICLQFKKGRYLDKQLLKDIYTYASSNDDVEFHFITTHMLKVGLTYQYLPKYESKNIFIDAYESPSQLLGVLKSCDLIVTSMLHVGLLGLTEGTPFVSYRGPGKTKSFLKSIGGSWAILPENISLRELLDNYLFVDKSGLMNRYDADIISEMKEGSKKQYDFCTLTVKQFG